MVVVITDHVSPRNAVFSVLTDQKYPLSALRHLSFGGTFL
jgi:hypothetical protein